MDTNIAVGSTIQARIAGNEVVETLIAIDRPEHTPADWLDEENVIYVCTPSDVNADNWFYVYPSEVLSVEAPQAEAPSVWDELLAAVSDFADSITAEAQPVSPKSEGVALSFSDVPGVDFTADTQQVNATLLWLAIRYELEVEFDYQKAPVDYVLPRSLDPDKIEGADEGNHALVGGTDPDTGEYRQFRTDRIVGFVRLAAVAERIPCLTTCPRQRTTSRLPGRSRSTTESLASLRW
jgi:predicted DNA-binding transcriptional regulator YafY